jgi:hypothetical protein
MKIIDWVFRAGSNGILSTNRMNTSRIGKVRRIGFNLTRNGKKDRFVTNCETSTNPTLRIAMIPYCN